MESKDGVYTQVGENGFQLSGGQKQKLGIARALFSNPKILVLDSSTSALDGLSEKQVGESIAQLPGDVTIIAVAHRLSTIRGFDRIALVEKGLVLGVDDFEGLKNRFPEFAAQAKQLGL